LSSFTAEFRQIATPNFFQIILQNHFITGLEVQAIRRRRVSLTQVLP
jgi:hypothetical protein